MREAFSALICDKYCVKIAENAQVEVAEGGTIIVVGARLKDRDYAGQMNRLISLEAQGVLRAAVLLEYWGDALHMGRRYMGDQY